MKINTMAETDAMLVLTGRQVHCSSAYTVSLNSSTITTAEIKKKFPTLPPSYSLRYFINLKVSP